MAYDYKVLQVNTYGFDERIMQIFLQKAWFNIFYFFSVKETC